MKENAMYSEIKDSRKENYGVSVALLCVAQMKEKYCFEKRSNYNIGDKKSRLNCLSEKKQL